MVERPDAFELQARLSRGRSSSPIQYGKCCLCAHDGLAHSMPNVASGCPGRIWKDVAGHFWGEFATTPYDLEKTESCPCWLDQYQALAGTVTLALAKKTAKTRGSATGRKVGRGSHRRP